MTKGAVLLLCMVSQRSESVCVDHWEISEAPTSDHLYALRRKDESENLFNELNGRQERICAPLQFRCRALVVTQQEGVREESRDSRE